MQKMNYSTYHLFKDNATILKGLRPDFYLYPIENGYKIMGEITAQNNFVEFYEEYSKTVLAINTSIILNATSFFEGFLENILLRKIGSIKGLQSPIKKIVSDYQNLIIRISSISEFKKQFYTLFGDKLNNILASNKDDLDFIEKFYLIRHLISHGSMIETDFSHQEFGTKILHTEPEYLLLMKILAKRFGFKDDINIEYMSLLLHSQIIDDFSKTVFNIADLLVNELKNRKLLDLSDYWGDFNGWNSIGKLIPVQLID